MVFYQRWLDAQEGGTPEASAILKQIRDYNEEDCRSTAELAGWLRLRQQERGIVAIGKIVPEISESETKSRIVNERRHTLAREILQALPERRPEGEAGERHRVTELLAHLLEFHRREEKPIWWRRFDREEKDERELIDDPECLGGLQRTARLPEPVKKSLSYEYSFDPHQETKIRAGDDCRFAHNWKKKAKVDTLDLDSGRALLVLGRQQEPPPDRLSIAPDEMTSSDRLAPAVERVVNRWHHLGRLPGAIEDFLFRRRPRLLGNTEGPIVPEDRDALEGAIETVLDMRSTILCVQGPPGSGKTYTAQLLRTARISKACPFNGWKGCVTVKTCIPPSSRPAIRAFRQRKSRARHRISSPELLAAARVHRPARYQSSGQTVAGRSRQSTPASRDPRASARTI
jgi:uncharacterized protein